MLKWVAPCLRSGMESFQAVFSKPGSDMKIQAAITHAQREPFSIEEMNLSGPGVNEVLVRIVATGVCHTDAV
ncbi:MAG TPA: hypothetical protein VIQ28_00340, partial [Burkholderiales bacterium]